MPTTSTLVSSCCQSQHPDAVDDTSHNHWSPTATLALQRRWRRIKEWYTDSYPTTDTGNYEPPWVSARDANLESCGLYWLPDELVLKILNNLDDLSKAMALRTCGLLMRIIFDQTHLSQLFERRYLPTDIRVWPPFEQPSWNFAPSEILTKRKQLNHLLDRDRFCNPCRQFRQDGRYKNAIKTLEGTLWCSHCNKPHKRPLFSAHQRAAFLATRICILAEGRAQFCPHLSIGWYSAQNTSSSKDKGPCRHPDHEPAWHTFWKGSFTSHRSPSYKMP